METSAHCEVLSSNEFDRLMKSISKQPKSDHLKAIVATGYYTGMRSGEIFSLTWDKVDLKNKFIRLKPEDTKDREARNIPICKELVEIFLSLPNRIQETGSDNHVFQYAGKPVSDVRYALKKACKDAGILYGRNVENGFTLHDLRHTFNTNMRKAGVAESVIMEITGHSTREMFDRYNTVDEDDTRDAIETMENYLDSVSVGGIVERR